MFSKGDFHIHSTASDGDLSPGDIVATAKSRGVDTIALADHNTTSGIYEAAETGKQLGVSIIPGVELSTRYKGESIHVLGYFRNELYNDKDFQRILKLAKEHKFKRAKGILKDFIDLECREGCFTVLEGIGLLRAYGAAVVLAHPVRISKRHLAGILNLPFDGIEAKYCINNNFDTSYFINTALSRFSFYTGGSDFHTNKAKDTKHCPIGEPYLNSLEIKRFFEKSGAKAYYT